MMAEVSLDHARRVHRRLKRTGQFWQGRFGCEVMDDAHLGVALSCVLLNPVRARLVERAAEWRWSNAGSLCGGAPDRLSPAVPILAFRPGLPELLMGEMDDASLSLHDGLRRAESIGLARIPIGARGDERARLVAQKRGR